MMSVPLKSFYHPEIYYKGFIIQQTIRGFVVSDRVDRSKPKIMRFNVLKDAEQYVDEKTKKH